MCMFFVFFFLTLEIWFNSDIGPVFQPGESDSGVKNVKKWCLVGPRIKFQNFSILITDLDLDKKCNIKVSFFLYSDRNTVKFKFKVTKSG